MTRHDERVVRHAAHDHGHAEPCRQCYFAMMAMRIQDATRAYRRKEDDIVSPMRRTLPASAEQRHATITARRQAMLTARPPTVGLKRHVVILPDFTPGDAIEEGVQLVPMNENAADA